MQQLQPFLLGDLSRLLRRHLFARPRAMVGDDDARAVSGGGVALGRRRVDRHDDGDGNAERFAGGRQPLREIAGGIGDDAFLRLGGRQLLQPPVSAADLERAGPLQRFRLDENARRTGHLCKGGGFKQRRHLRRLRRHGVGALQMVELGDNRRSHHSPFGKRFDSFGKRSMPCRSELCFDEVFDQGGSTCRVGQPVLQRAPDVEPVDHRGDRLGHALGLGARHQRRQTG